MSTVLQEDAINNWLYIYILEVGIWEFIIHTMCMYNFKVGINSFIKTYI